MASKIATGDLGGSFQRVEAMLREHDFDFCFELTEEGQNAVLVLTPEGDLEQARRIDNLLEARPRIDGWLFYGRRQRKPWSDALVFVRHIYGADLSDATFEVKETSQSFEVVMWSKAVSGLTDDEARGLVSTLLDHAVGEEVVMARVAGVVAYAEGTGCMAPSALIATLVGN
jgi:hypothetical protein